MIAKADFTVAELNAALKRNGFIILCAKGEHQPAILARVRQCKFVCVKCGIRVNKIRNFDI